MEKVVIIKNCSECINSHNNFAMMNGNAPMGVLSGGAFLGCTKTLHLCPDEGIPDWCPLSDLPERLLCEGDSERIKNYRLEARKQGVELRMGSFGWGWNTCLDEITGGSN